MKREHYLIVQAVMAAARSVSTMYQANGAEGEYSSEEWEEVIKHIAAGCSKMELDNLAVVAEQALKKKE